MVNAQLIATQSQRDLIVYTCPSMSLIKSLRRSEYLWLILATIRNDDLFGQVYRECPCIVSHKFTAELVRGVGVCRRRVTISTTTDIPGLAVCLGPQRVGYVNER